MKILCVIPSRIASTRLARKPLLPIQGKPMIAWVYENAARTKSLSKIIVATDSEEIANVVKEYGGEAQLTDPNLPTGTDRVAHIAKSFPDMDIIINLQGDEPFVKPKMLEQLIAPFYENPNIQMTTLAAPIKNQEEFQNPGIVKVLTNIDGDAIYFSRSPIPYFRTERSAPVYHHLGYYAFRREFLLKYTTLPQTPLELTELLEQLRVLEHGYPIRVCITEDATMEINTPEEYQAAQQVIYQAN